MAIPGIRDRKVEIIKSVVCDYYSVSAQDVLSKIRKRDMADARHVLYFLLWDILDWGPVKIGSYLGTDHTNVIHGRDKIRGFIYVLPPFKKEMNWLRQKIKDKFAENNYIESIP